MRLEQVYMFVCGAGRVHLAPGDLHLSQMRNQASGCLQLADPCPTMLGSNYSPSPATEVLT